MKLCCDFAVTKKMTIAERLQRSRQGFIKGRNKVAAMSVIGCHTNSVMASLLSIHKRLAATDFDRLLVAKVF